MCAANAAAVARSFPMTVASPRSSSFTLGEDATSAASPPHSIEKIEPLSFSQQQMWYVCHFQSATVAYNQPLAWRLHGRLDARALEQSLNSIISRHESLRTTFSLRQGNPVQVIHRELPLMLRTVDVRAETEPEQRTRELVLEEASYPFDLANEILLRGALLQTGDEDYVFILTIHHLVCDGWSMGILLRELAPLYRAAVLGSTPVLPAVQLQYSDFVVWQREQLQGQKLEEQLAYWKERLEKTFMAEIPTDWPISPTPTFRGANQPFALPKELSTAFKALCAGEGVFLFMGLLAVLQLLLCRYTGETDIVVGAPVAARKRSKLQGSIGLFLNLVALRTDFSGDPSFRELLKQVCGVVMGAYQHQDAPFERVVEEVHPPRTSGRNPLFQVTLDQVDPKWIALDLEGVSADWFSVDNKTSKFDLTLAWFDSPNGLRGWLEYNTDLFDEVTITRLQGHYRTLVESVIANPDQPVSRVSLLTAAERRQRLVEWNQTQADYPDSCIHELFELQSLQTPHAIAVETDSSQITYLELNQHANQLAHHLARVGVSRGSLVGVCLGRSIDLMVALLAILKSGAAYVPLDPAYPSQRLAFMLEDSGAKAVVTKANLAGALPANRALFVCLDLERERLAEESCENPALQSSPDDTAYVIYTSGSTGQPKGVLGLHRGAVNRFAWMWKAYPFEPGEVACAKTSPNFVDSIWELFGPLLAGVKTAFIPEEVAKSPHDLVTALAEHRVTRLVLVPSLLSAMLDSEPDIAHRLPNLKFWISSGEALNLNLIGRLREMAPGRVLLNLYGSSEASADVTCYDIREMPNDGPVLIGKPIANTEIYILDKHLHPVPIGVAGQLCVSGAGLASGYLNRPGLSAEKFIADPFSVDPFGVNPLRRLYLTGDLARYRSDGNIELLGRIDRQVKIRGIRVEPEEVEEALRQHPSVAQAVVVPRNVTASETKLVAYIVQKAPPREHNFVQLLRQYASEQMPGPMIPSAFVVLPDLPLLPNGKIDRHSLPEPDSPTNTAGLAEPSNSTERCILQIWREVLQIESVGTHENFFDLGGHSLLLTAVQNKLSKVFNRQIVSIDLYRYPTISSLAKRLDDHALESRPLGLVQECAQKQRDARRRKRPTVALRVE